MNGFQINCHCIFVAECTAQACALKKHARALQSCECNANCKNMMAHHGSHLQQPSATQLHEDCISPAAALAG